MSKPRPKSEAHFPAFQLGKTWAAFKAEAQIHGIAGIDFVVLRNEGIKYHRDVAAKKCCRVFELLKWPLHDGVVLVQKALGEMKFEQVPITCVLKELYRASNMLNFIVFADPSINLWPKKWSYQTRKYCGVQFASKEANCRPSCAGSSMDVGGVESRIDHEIDLNVGTKCSTHR